MSTRQTLTRNRSNVCHEGVIALDVEVRPGYTRPVTEAAAAPEGRATSSASQPPSLPRSLRVGIVVACALVAFGSMSLVLSFGHGRDQSIYTLVARETLAGGMPYRDAFDFKPPGIFLVYALGRLLSGSSPLGVRTLEVVAMLANCAALLRIARRELDDEIVGWIALAMTCAIHTQLDFWHTGQPETFGGPLGLWAIVLACEAGRAGDGVRKVRLLLTIGLLCGIAGLMKPPLVGAAPVAALLAAWLDDQRSPGRSLTSRSKRLAAALVWVALGSLAPIALIAAWFAARGALGDLYQVLFVFTPQYTKISWEGADPLHMLYYGFVEWLTTYSSALLAGMILTAVVPWAKRARPVLVAILAMCTIHVLGVVMQAKFFPYHWAATFPPTALLAAVGYTWVIRRAAQRDVVLGAAVTTLSAAVATLHAPVPNMGPVLLERAGRRVAAACAPDSAERTSEVDLLASIADVDARDNRAAAALVARWVPEGQPIFVWGFEPSVYDLANRPLSSRYIYDVPQRAVWSKEAMRAALMRDLEARPPAAIVVEHHDVFPFVTGDSLDSFASLEEFRELDELLLDHYRIIGVAGDLEVWLNDETLDRVRLLGDPN